MLAYKCNLGGALDLPLSCQGPDQSTPSTPYRLLPGTSCSQQLFSGTKTHSTDAVTIASIWRRSPARVVQMTEYSERTSSETILMKLFLDASVNISGGGIARETGPTKQLPTYYFSRFPVEHPPPGNNHNRETSATSEMDPLIPFPKNAPLPEQWNPQNSPAFSRCMRDVFFRIRVPGNSDCCS